MAGEAVVHSAREKERQDEAPQHVLAAGPLQAAALRSVMRPLFLLASSQMRVSRDFFLP